MQLFWMMLITHVSVLFYGVRLGLLVQVWREERGLWEEEVRRETDNADQVEARLSIAARTRRVRQG